MKGLSVEEDCGLKADLLTLINVIVNFPTEVSIRMQLRNEFISLGILEVVTLFAYLQKVSLR